MTIMLLLVFVAFASANVVLHHGKCPDFKPVQNFNVSAFQGTWYEVSKYPYDAEKNGKCSSVEYKLQDKEYKVKNMHVVNGVQTYIEGTAKLADDANNAGKLTISLKFGDVIKTSPLMILTTDYTQYAIAHNCNFDDKNNSHKGYEYNVYIISHPTRGMKWDVNVKNFVWVLSRSKKLQGDAKTAVDNFLKTNPKELDTTKFLQTDFSEAACKFNSTSVITEAPVKS